jgi:rhodanese-related sulfurtransferase
VERNRSGAAPLEELSPVPALTPAQVVASQSRGAVVLDTRPFAQFAAAHIPRSINIALAGQFASWAARMLGIDTQVVLLAEDDAAVKESRLRLARVGLESVAGSVAGGMMGWIDAGMPTQSVDQIAAPELDEWMQSGANTLLDVREAAERHAGFIPGAISIPLPELEDRLAELEPAGPVAVHCRGGYRSAIASSLLQSAGFKDVVNVIGGYDAWALTSPAAAVR